MNQEELAKRLTFHNPWWETGKVPQVFIPAFTRFAFDEVLRFSTLDRIVIMKGPRRTGKTTILYQLIDRLLTQEVSPKDILYLSLDDPLLTGVSLDVIFQAFEFIRGKLLKNPQSYIFLDEAQFLSNWELTVKLYYDRKYPMRFTVSGSAVSLLTQKQESLAGRTIEKTLLPFSFAEMVLLAEKNTTPLKQAIDALPSIQALTAYPASLIPYESALSLHLQQFLQFGGFPHLPTTPKELWTRLLQEDIVQKVIFRDLVTRFGIRDPQSLEKLFGFIAQTTSGVMNVTTLASNLSLSRPVIDQYLSYLEQSFLLFRLAKFSHSPKERMRSNPKGHCIDPGLATLFGASVDQRLETAVADHLFSRYGADHLLFWRDQHNEVDLIIEGTPLLPIEVKNTNHQTLPSGLAHFINRYHLPVGMVVYHGSFTTMLLGKNAKIYFIPASLFLLTSSHS